MSSTFCLKKQFLALFFAEIVYMDFYDRVKQLAKENKGLSIQEFVLSIGLNHDSYYSLRRDGNLPRADEALKIARALGTTVEYLCTGADTGKPDTAPLIAHAQALLDGLKNL
jgi:transcriptional regulator with XRE-family HTH domain